LIHPAARHVLVNRAPVLTLWAAVVAERLGFDRPAALSLGKAWPASTPRPRAALGQRFGEALPATPSAPSAGGV
jgi:hypothetical protein